VSHPARCIPARFPFMYTTLIISTLRYSGFICIAISYTQIYTHAHTPTHTHTPAYVHTHTHTHTQIYIHAHTQTRACTRSGGFWSAKQHNNGLLLECLGPVTWGSSGVVVCFKIKGQDFLWSLVYSVEATARKNQ